MEWMLMPLRRYAQFSGRSRRKEFWMWALFVFILSVILSILDKALGLGGSADAYGQPAAAGAIGYNAGARFSGGVLTTIFNLATLIPSLAVAVRRLHDINRTGWWLLAPILSYVIGFALVFAGVSSQSVGTAGAGGLFMVVGFICVIVLLIFYCLPGTRGPNRYGEDPLGHSTEQLAETFQ